MHIINQLPKIKGKIIPNAPLAPITWFRVGGNAEILCIPQDHDDLVRLLENLRENIPITVIGVGSNLLVRDGGVKGVVIRLGKGFAYIKKQNENQIVAGAAVPDAKIARAALQYKLKGLTFLRGIPGTIGGAIRMNAGAAGAEIKDVFIQAKAVNRNGQTLILREKEMQFNYRSCEIAKDVIFTEATLQAEHGDEKQIAHQMNEIIKIREKTQPVKEKTGGSTFKNPQQGKAWQYIEKAGMRGKQIGGAKISEKHCNFIINKGNATAEDIENLANCVKREVRKKTNINLQWEIKIIGEKKR